MNIYRAKRIDDNLIVEGVYNISNEIGRAYPHEIFFESKWHEIDQTTLEVVKLSFNTTQQKKLIHSAKNLLCNDDLHDYLWNIQYYAKYMIQENKLNKEFIDEAIEQIDWLLEVFKEVQELLKGI